MDTFKLGKTSLLVSKLCFGTLPMGPLQRGLSLEEGAKVIGHALDAGVNFIDTAQVYGTYEHIRLAKQGKPEPIISSKSRAQTYEDMQKAVEEALEALDVGSIGIFHLHAPREGADVFINSSGAFQCLQDYKAKGLIQAVGIATHTVAAVKAAALRDDLDVVFPLINYQGLGIPDGNAQDMLMAISQVAQKGVGIYAMKVFAGGNLLRNKKQALDFVFDIPGIDVVAIGMVTVREVDMNLQLIAGQEVMPDSPYYVPIEDKELTIGRFCIACGKCLPMCPNQALTIVDEKAKVNKEKCILCGYCSPVCPQFAIRLI